ncbi:hypothetical protein [Reichenbachiella versicolor]|uniref:hypothetical protein n=1 Tax=Reichenbachiella versicolor TaxID=1821036 RepID=UPI000D6E2779|nr:hypothetical protein [Reichenbachiella versicolor]
MANKSISRIEGILQFYSKALSKDYNAYRNHVYRIYHLSLIYYNHEIKDKEEELFAIACTFHKLGIWTHHSMNYISPSIDLAKSYMRQNGLQSEKVVEIMIEHHHKITPSDNSLAESIRKAHKIDLSFGMLKSKMKGSYYSILKTDFPYLGFQFMMTKKLLSYAVRNPFDPFPMVKK